MCAVYTFAISGRARVRTFHRGSAGGPSARLAHRRDLPDHRDRGGRSRPGAAAGAQPDDERGPVHAGADGRPEVVRAAVPGRRGAAGWRGRRGRRFDRGRLRARRHRAARSRLARVRPGQCAFGRQGGPVGGAAGGVPRGAGDDRADRVRGAPAHRRVQAGRRGLRLQRGRRRRPGGRPAGPDPRRRPGHRQCRFRGQGRLSHRRPGLRRGVRLSRRNGARAAQEGCPGRHRRVFRQRRRGPPGSRDLGDAAARPRHRLRHDQRLQRHRADARAPQPGHADRQADHHARHAGRRPR
jgi:hypothetical protein